MANRILPIIRLAFLVLLAGFSAFSNADFSWTYSGAPQNYGSQSAACQSMPGQLVPANWILSGGIDQSTSDQYGSLTAQCLFSEPEGASRSIYRVGSAPICSGGQSYDPVSQTCLSPPPPCLHKHPQTLACVASCSDLSGAASYHSWGSINSTSKQGCSTICAMLIDGDSVAGWPVICRYTGESSPEGESEEEGEHANSPPEGSEPPPPESEGESQPCPPGTVEGQVNGERYCAPGGAEPEPPVNPSEADPTGLGDKLEAIRRSVEGVRSNAAATGTAINQQTKELQKSLTELKGAIEGQGDGGGDGTGSGAGDCDPTSDDYFVCAGLVEEVADDHASNLRTGLDAEADAVFDDYAADAQAALDNIVNNPTPGPDGLTSFFESVIPQPTSCTQLTLAFPGHTLQLPCERFDFLKILFGWMLSCMTAIYIFRLVTASGAN